MERFIYYFYFNPIMEKISEFEEFIDKNIFNGNDFSSVSPKKMENLRKSGHSVESLLDYMVQNYNVLLHGSTHDIQDRQLNSQRGIIYASNMASIALLKSVLSNKNANLRYPFKLENKDSLIVMIEGLNEKTIRENGFVYIIPSTDKFEFDVNTSWQYARKTQTAPIIAKIPTTIYDFKYPVFDVSDPSYPRKLH
jgi:hypothetical protein